MARAGVIIGLTGVARRAALTQPTVEWERPSRQSVARRMAL